MQFKEFMDVDVDVDDDGYSARCAPYCVAVEVIGCGITGSGFVLQYRYGAPGNYVSEDWWLVTAYETLCVEGTLCAGARVLFFHDAMHSKEHIAVRLDMSTTHAYWDDGGDKQLFQLAVIR